MVRTYIRTLEGWTRRWWASCVWCTFIFEYFCLGASRRSFRLFATVFRANTLQASSSNRWWLHSIIYDASTYTFTHSSALKVGSCCPAKPFNDKQHFDSAPLSHLQTTTLRTFFTIYWAVYLKLFGPAAVFHFHWLDFFFPHFLSVGVCRRFSSSRQQ